MEKLSPNAEALTRAGRAALKPTEADRKRVLLALGARLGDFGNAGEASHPGRDVPTPPRPGLPGLPGWPAISAVVAGLALGGGLLFQLQRAHATGPLAPPPALSVGLLPSPNAPPAARLNDTSEGVTPGEVAPLPPDAAPPPSGAASAASSRSSREAKDSLAQEVAILSRAESALHAGRFTAALAALAEHEQRFPRGTLTQERIAARVQALCGLGKVKASRVELARLAPGSLLEGRAREACAAHR